MIGRKIKRSYGNPVKKSTQHKSMKFGKFLGFALFCFFISPKLYAVQDPVDEFSGESAFEYLEKQVAFGPRNPGSTGHRNCLQFLTEELKKYTPNVTIQPFLHKDNELNRTFSLSNIIARFPGNNPNEQKILLAAHWDTRHRADRESDQELKDQPILGANDGASGVAVLLEVARILSENPPPFPVDIVLFDGEDYGRSGDLQNYLLGAKYFAANWRSGPYQFGLLLDMVGDKNLSLKKEGYSSRMLPYIVDQVWKRAQKLNLRAFENRRGSEIYDDHQPLIQAGIPIIDIIQSDLVGSKYWHTLDDTPDKCSPASLLQVGILVISLIFDGL